MGTILFTGGSILNYVFGILVIIVSLYNVLIIFIHPAFKKGGMKITDDPTQNYTAGENVIIDPFLHPLEISNIMTKNPALAQKVLVGASKLAQ